MTLKEVETVGIQESGVGFDERWDERKSHSTVWTAPPEDWDNKALVPAIYGS